MSPSEYKQILDKLDALTYLVEELKSKISDLQTSVQAIKSPPPSY